MESWGEGERSESQGVCKYVGCQKIGVLKRGREGRLSYERGERWSSTGLGGLKRLFIEFTVS